ncbi:2-oxoacid:ferredoxin oxidoreductase subunit beta [bacterium]|nr:2-oxoacid:ferredoxin oxidoreductase subunit beta [bacterium]
MFNKALNIHKYLRRDMYPSIFCVGCGVGSVLNHTLRAVDELKLDMDKSVFVSGIGCSSRLPGYIDGNGLHTTHGRAIAFATGVKLANPELNVIIFTGDGDCAAIGGNHLIHAARRNLNLTVIEMNNFNYGMTGGQTSPTTPRGSNTTTSPYGNFEEPFDLADLVVGAGATFVARWPLGYPYETIACIKKGIAHQGFSFIEILIPCPTGYTDKNDLKTNKEIWEWYRGNTILRSKYKLLNEQEQDQNHKLVIGELRNVQRKEYTTEWAKLVNRLRDEQDRSGRLPTGSPDRRDYGK